MSLSAGLILLALSASQATAQQKGQSVLIIDPQESQRAAQRAKATKQAAAENGPLINDAGNSKTYLSFTGTPRSDLPAFNFVVTTTHTDCEELCEFRWLVNQGTKITSRSLGSNKGMSALKPNTNYLVEWIKPDSKNPRLAREIKLAK